ncbi:MAG: GTP pyrophosphokinase family protein [Candidatus Fimousia sp.]|uniref:GTP pyrophosphokinase n=1 Tax=Anaerostipes sp. 992a TaxID=1261637 RepID=UPI000952B073|nr:hypothetical protein [Anaerostipes sp. 992a]MDD5968837.1 hypothetical protein [Anaerostipes sp.]OLR62015.1 hypothetical protein BHF69_04555 [Anaerostipes sp. 992a]
MAKQAFIQQEDLEAYQIMEEKFRNIKYRIKCKMAVDLMISKINMIGTQLLEKRNRVVIENITYRFKSVESTYKKLKKKGCPIDFRTALDRCNDLIGIRVTCHFLDDVYEIAKKLKSHGDLEIIKEKDYIKKPKANGYMSLHLILKVPVYSSEKCEKKKVEVQIRTVAMDFFSVLDYQLLYKKDRKEGVAEIEEELRHYSDVIAKLDKNMLRIRKKIESL